MKPKNLTNTNWSINLGYAIGLLVADGNLSPDQRHINFTTKDKELAELFKKCLSLKNVIGRKGNCAGNEKIYYAVQFGDVNFYRWCQSIGIMAKKSKVIAEIKVPDKYFFDFFRGCIDGDGTSYAYWDKRWSSSYMYYLSISSASKNFLEWLQKKTKELANVSGSISTVNESFQLRFAKKESAVLFYKMYYRNNLPFLQRKYKKLYRFLEKDKRAQVEKLANSQA